MRRSFAPLTFILLLLISTGCSHVLPQAQREGIDPDVDYTQVKQNSERLQGKKILWGGLILDSRADSEQSELTLYSYKLDRWGEPVAVDDEGGRFLLRSPKFLDPVIFDKGLFITLTGFVKGIETRPVGENFYNFPVIELEKYHLWEGPFRWGLKPHPNIYVPYYIEDKNYPRSHPYDPGPNWGPYWYRPAGTK